VEVVPLADAEAAVEVEVELGDVVAGVLEVEAVVAEEEVGADVVEPLVEAGCVVDSAAEAGLPVLFAFAPQAKVAAVKHTSTAVLNNICFFMEFYEFSQVWICVHSPWRISASRLEYQPIGRC
jgi:hypothetical protein